MQFVMQPDMVYRYPLWGVALLLARLAVAAAIVLELLVRRFVSVEFRRRHNDAAAIFSIIGVTFAVLLAFVAMLAWEGFNFRPLTPVYWQPDNAGTANGCCGRVYSSGMPVLRSPVKYVASNKARIFGIGAPKFLAAFKRAMLE